MFGKGFLEGSQSHLNFLPEKQTDFIFTMLAEELGLVGGLALIGLRSEEPTSELQSLMRSSYAVFCVRKNRIRRQTYQHSQIKRLKSKNARQHERALIIHH